MTTQPSFAPVPVIYVAGRFRAPTAWGIAENIRAAERVGLEVARAGGMPLIPHANTAHFHGEGDDALWIAGTLELMRRCDAVLLVSGWEKSLGTLGEVEEARRRRMPVRAFGDGNRPHGGPYAYDPTGVCVTETLAVWISYLPIATRRDP